MKKLLTIASVTFVALAVPLVSFAQIRDLTGAGAFIINTINNILVPVLFAVAFIVFLWGAFDAFILGANDEEKKGQGKNLMLYSIIGFFVMVSIWGLVNIFTGTIQFGDRTGPAGGMPGAGVQVR